MAGVTSPVEELRVIEKRLVYGSYPDVVTHPGDEIDRLREIGRGYLYKDILKYEAIRRPEILDRLMRALAFQIGQEVDLVEESANGLKAFEIKWNPKKAAEPLSRTFTNAYPSAETFGVSPDNVFEFLAG